jgi:hypothetical protein
MKSIFLPRTNPSKPLTIISLFIYNAINHFEDHILLSYSLLSAPSTGIGMAAEKTNFSSRGRQHQVS